MPSHQAHPDWCPSLRSLQAAYDCRFNDQVETAAFRPLAASLAEVGLVLVDESVDEYKQEWIEGLNEEEVDDEEMESSESDWDDEESADESWSD